ncbi:zinc-dependent alcohol dehydrogenase [Halobacillus amylolyticus]|uniref:Alcohol dehydrogenase catalytic domain-containing protein n=1 Tax=Halobacillus amylolyticus TaxID=2932259 RepID=A0ABY4HGG1_9BACI|nr:alcohol dehydrogenase catalytic domain-containing protein [Halobacillus amylolyticus]UOR13974.1 alcohol dehydrogenase catalytic domain-containing protein [Halobacillus amylolyticus]
MYGLFLKNPSDLELREFASIPTLQDDEVKLRLIYGGICGSDVNVYKGKIEHASYPVSPGHELVGEIVQTGANVKENIGQRVVIQPNSFCGECNYCKSGQTNICPEKKSLGVNVNGGFVQEFVISSKYVLPVPEELANEKAVLIEPFAVIVHAFKKVSITQGTTVAIIGCGAEGMLAVALANHLGANITAVDINQEKLNKVQSHYNGIKTCLPEDVEAGKFDVVIEAAGAKQSFEQGVDILKPGGAMVVVGMAPKAELPVTRMVRKELTLYGSIIYNFPDDFLISIEYLQEEDFNVQPIISEILPLNEYKKAYEYAASGQYGKIILNFQEA